MAGVMQRPPPPPHDQPAASRSRTQVFGLLVRDCMRPAREVLVVRPETRVADMIAAFVFERAACIVVADRSGRPAGIIEDGDIARRIAFRVPPETPASAVMTAPLITVGRGEYLYHAIATMRRHGLKRLPVTDRQGRLAGLLDLTDALAVAAEGLLQQIDRLSHEGTIDGMRAVKAAQVELAEALFEDNLPATDIQQLLTRINNDLYRRIGEQALQQMAAAGWGELPLSAATIVMGSGGRGENFLMPDQDNGFVIADYPDADHARIDAFFLELAERMCRDLNAVGIRYCNGYCMAINPLWRKTLSQWREQIALWVRKSNFVSIRLSDIFFDFQPVWGQSELADELRHTVTRLVRGNPLFLRQMFQETAEHTVALGFFGGFVTERDDRAHRGEINLKLKGILPLVSAVRLLALRHGSEETATLARIGVLAAAGVLAAGEAEDLRGAFALITDMLLRQQIADFKVGREVGYFIDPQPLTKRRRAALHDALRAIETLRKRVDYEFTAQLF